MLELQPVERGIAATGAQQFFVTAGLHDTPSLNHQDGVGMHDGGQPVRDHQRRAATAKFGDRVLHVAFRLRVERGGRLIEQDDRRIAHQSTRDGDALTLTARKLEAVFADGGIVTQRK